MQLVHVALYSGKYTEQHCVIGGVFYGFPEHASAENYPEANGQRQMQPRRQNAMILLTTNSIPKFYQTAKEVLWFLAHLVCLFICIFGFFFLLSVEWIFTIKIIEFRSWSQEPKYSFIGFFNYQNGEFL